MVCLRVNCKFFEALAYRAAKFLPELRSLDYQERQELGGRRQEEN
ncbi:hypothetical protein [Nostoc flagelliforme]|nr:hypothetical protein [Nostoc flagelliforme]